MIYKEQFPTKDIRFLSSADQVSCNLVRQQFSQSNVDTPGCPEFLQTIDHVNSSHTDELGLHLTNSSMYEVNNWYSGICSFITLPSAIYSDVNFYQQEVMLSMSPL